MRLQEGFLGHRIGYLLSSIGRLLPQPRIVHQDRVRKLNGKSKSDAPGGDGRNGGKGKPKGQGKDKGKNLHRSVLCIHWAEFALCVWSTFLDDLWRFLGLVSVCFCLIENSPVWTFLCLPSCFCLVFLLLSCAAMHLDRLFFPFGNSFSWDMSGVLLMLWVLLLQAA